MDYEKAYKEALERANQLLIDGCSNYDKETIWNIFPEIMEDKDERIRKEILEYIDKATGCKEWVAWLKKQGEKSEQKEINLAEILKHYPRETELYSPLYGKLWLAEVDEECKIITCYKHPLDKGCTRAILKQEDTVSFYSNGTTGLPDCSVSNDCMLFLYDSEKQGEQKSAWSEEDEKWIDRACMLLDELNHLETLTLAKIPHNLDDIINHLKSLKNRVQPHLKPTEEQIHCFKCVIDFYKTKVNDTIVLNLLDSLYNKLVKL